MQNCLILKKGQIIFFIPTAGLTDERVEAEKRLLAHREHQLREDFKPIKAVERPPSEFEKLLDEYEAFDRMENR